MKLIIAVLAAFGLAAPVNAAPEHLGGVTGCYTAIRHYSGAIIRCNTAAGHQFQASGICLWGAHKYTDYGYWSGVTSTISCGDLHKLVQINPVRVRHI